MKRKVTIQDIANMVNVSKSSVSRYLNNGYVSEENAKKIKEAIEKTGFETNFFAKRLKTKRSKLIGIILPRINSVTAGHLLMGITQKLEENNYQGIILVSNLSIEKEIANISSLAQQGVDGIIVNSIAITEEHIRLINRLNIPTIFTGQKSDFTNYIKIDDYEAGKMMGNYFKNNNHKKVVFAGVDEKDIAVGIERKKGFIDAFTQDNENSRVDFVKTSFSFENAYKKAEEILKYNPTGIVSIAGFGGYDVGSVSYPTLTTVEFNYELIGEKTAEGILELIEGKNIKEDSTISLKLIERESVKKI